jgi:hypothetical protein
MKTEVTRFNQAGRRETLHVGDKATVRWTNCNRQYEGKGEVSKVNDKTARVRLTEEVPVQGGTAYPVGREIIAPIVNDTVGNCIIPVVETEAQ